MLAEVPEVVDVTEPVTKAGSDVPLLVGEAVAELVELGMVAEGEPVIPGIISIGYVQSSSAQGGSENCKTTPYLLVVSAARRTGGFALTSPMEARAKKNSAKERP